MSIFDKISSLITGSKPEKREPEKVSSSSAEKPVETVKKPARPTPIIEKKPQRFAFYYLFNYFLKTTARHMIAAD